VFIAELSMGTCGGVRCPALSREASASVYNDNTVLNYVTYSDETGTGDVI